MSGSATPLLGLPYVVPGQAAAELADSDTKRTLDMLVQSGVISITNTPPGSPAEGDLYVCGTSPTGAWAGRANNLALRVGGGWFFKAPGTASRWRVFNRADGQDYRWSGTAWAAVVAGAGAGRADVLRTVSAFSWRNQGGATATDRSYGISMRAPGTASDNFRVLERTAPSPPYRVRARMRPALVSRANLRVGMAFIENSSGRLQMLSLYGDAAGPRVYVSNYTNVTTFSANIGGSGIDGAALAPFEWWSLRDDNTNRHFEISADGDEWITLLSISRTSFLTPDRVGFCLNPAYSATPYLDAGLTLFSWEEA